MNFNPALRILGCACVRCCHQRGCTKAHQYDSRKRPMNLITRGNLLGLLDWVVKKTDGSFRRSGQKLGEGREDHLRWSLTAWV